MYNLEEGPPSGKSLGLDGPGLQCEPVLATLDALGFVIGVNFEDFSKQMQAGEVFFEICVPMCRPKGHSGEIK